MKQIFNQPTNQPKGKSLEKPSHARALEAPKPRDCSSPWQRKCKTTESLLWKTHRPMGPAQPTMMLSGILPSELETYTHIKPPQHVQSSLLVITKNRTQSRCGRKLPHSDSGMALLGKNAGATDLATAWMGSKCNSFS